MTDGGRGKEPSGQSDAASPSKSPAAPEEKSSGRPARVLAIVLLSISALYVVWYLVADRYTPFTEYGRIDGFVVPVVPQVSGYLTEMDVRLHDVVDEGTRLARINPEPFEIAVRAAQASLEQAGQAVGAQTAGVESAVGRLGVSKAQLDRAQRNYDRVQRINARNPGALSQADRDRAETSLTQAQSKVISAEAEVEAAKASLGEEGPENPQIKAALAALEKAEFDLEQTELIAPFHGGVESLRTDVGQYAQAGQPIMSFVSARDVWIVANMRENNLGRIQPGDTAEVTLDVAPGQVFRATVTSTAYGVTYQGANRSAGQLPTAESQTGWLREPQRFPVILHWAEVDREAVARFCRVGGQASVVVYAGDSGFLDAIGRLRIRVASWLSYAH
ncbi:MAG: HlyD family secretion protein [Planctomycetota bacterium]